MRAHEFITEYIRSTKSDISYGDMKYNRAIDSGMPLGKGVYGVVYQHPTNKNAVIKYFLNDRGYAAYLIWILQHPNNKYVPHIIPQDNGEMYGYYKYYNSRTKENQRIGVVVMNKLVQATPQQIDALGDYVYQYLKPQDRQYYSAQDVSGNSNKFRILRSHDWLTISKNSASSDHDLSDIAMFISNLSNKYRIDLHSGNMMWDPERNRLVFTDIAAAQEVGTRKRRT